MNQAIQLNDKVEATTSTDLYALAFECYLFLGDKDKTFFKSLSENSIPAKERELMIMMGKFKGSEIVK